MSAEEFWRSEAEHWRLQAVQLVKRLHEIEEAARTAAFRDVKLPPEPPVGSRFDTDAAGPWIWRRLADGWHCPREGCRNCPAVWDEVLDHLPASRVLHLPAGGDW